MLKAPISSTSGYVLNAHFLASIHPREKVVTILWALPESTAISCILHSCPKFLVEYHGVVKIYLNQRKIS